MLNLPIFREPDQPTGTRVNGHTVRAVVPAPAIHTAAPPVPLSGVDFGVVRQLHALVTDEATAAGQQADIAAIAKRHVHEWVDGQRRAGVLISGAEERVLLDTLLADLVGLGRLQRLLEDPDIEDLHILGNAVRIKYGDGSIVAGPPIADSDGELLDTLQSLGQRAAGTERAMTSAEPWLDLELPGGSRLAALYEVTPPSADRTATTVPYAAIRRHRTKDVTLEQLIDMDMLDPLLVNYLRALMASRANIMVAGEMGAGKTTVLRALTAEIPPLEAFAVLEETRELGLHLSGRHPYALSLESRQGHGDLRPDGRPRGEITPADLIPRMLRMSVGRIIVGEVRSREIVAMLQAMTTCQGSMCTIHARTPRSVIDRIVELALSHSRDMTAELAKRMTANALDVILYVSKDDQSARGGSTHRYVSHLVEIAGSFEGDRVVSHEVFGPGEDGRAIPKHLPGERMAQMLLNVGYQPQQHLSGYIQAGRGAWPRQLQRPAQIGGWV